MVVFLTLFLGLASGIQPIELRVEDSVASVEVLLDGRSIGVLEEEPWTILVDLGVRLEPHHLEAVAFDARKREIDRAQQWVNLPRDHAEAAIILDGGADGKGVVASLSWESIFTTEPLSIAVSLDGEPIAVDDPGAIPLPPHDPLQLHFLRAEVDFPENVSSVVEVTFGGLYTDEVSTELTGVPVRLEAKGRFPELEQLQGWLLKNDQPLPVLAVEEGPQETFVVVDRGAQEAFRELARGSSIARSRLGLREAVQLGREQVVRFVSPHAASRGDGYAIDLFHNTIDFTSDNGGFFWLLTRYGSLPSTGQQRLADAVAVAGMSAAQRDRRRVVILILGEEPEDQSHFSPTEARHYLQQLGVPLYVWSPVADTSGLSSDWGEVTPLKGLVSLAKQFRLVTRDLNRQRIVWVPGVHLPQSIALSDAAAGISLAR